MAFKSKLTDITEVALNQLFPFFFFFFGAQLSFLDLDKSIWILPSVLARPFCSLKEKEV